MISKVHPLQMLVSLAMKLTVSFEMRLIAAESTRVVVVASDDNEFLLKAQPRTVLVDVIVQLFQVICVEV